MPVSSPASPGLEVVGAPFSSALLRLVRAHVLLGTRMFAEIGLAPPQELILLHLEEHGTVPQTEIVGMLQRDRSTVSSTLRSMEKAGLIHRTPAPDNRRALRISVTEAGLALCPAVREVWAQLESLAFGHLGPTTRAEVVRAMDASRAALVAALRQSP